MTNIQPGWYQDPNNAAQTRWWDGTQWTDHVTPGAPATATPAGLVSVSTNTAFAWIFAVLPILSIGTILIMNPSSYFATALEPDPSNPLAVFTPGYFGSLGLSLLLYLLYVLFALLDRRTLAARGIPRPFHWGWTFLTGWVYIIGRTVVVRRRTGTGGVGPLVVFIVVNVVTIVVVFAILIAAIASMMSTFNFS